ncbi:MAG: hypothetical protein H8E37_05040 [Planctomycetes bacterium]|nr:hypothetical protein [Planctomycetota bacterium]
MTDRLSDNLDPGSQNGIRGRFLFRPRIVLIVAILFCCTIAAAVAVQGLRFRSACRQIEALGGGVDVVETMPVPGLKLIGVGQIHVDLLGVNCSGEDISLLARSLRNLGPIYLIALGGHTSSLDDSTFSSIVSASHVENAFISYSAITDDGIGVARHWKGLQALDLQNNSQISLNAEKLQAAVPGVKVSVKP